MAQQEPEIIESTKKVDLVDNGALATYSNVSRCYINADEMTLHFALRRPDTPNEAGIVAKVYLPLSHAKRLTQNLVQLIESYENMFQSIDSLAGRPKDDGITEDSDDEEND